MIPRSTAWCGTAGDRRDETPADAARALARMAERLRPDWQQPERWHESKSELIDAFRRLVRTLEAG
ncbi:MAG: hypothetical protein LGL72_07270 [Acidibrevibacterium sp.]|uniref:hypothetical protein n=1 Tax=Acidibrevibacterium fodinaquatile TaxID=1969806 RepID=UPI0023A8EE79|nr:hypothetical protein [Acidibrevibacterium fodinaquatile]MCA7119197.1 hypothetical protein [Acidibrevibacterium fodinaquatile]